MTDYSKASFDNFTNPTENPLTRNRQASDLKLIQDKSLVSSYNSNQEIPIKVTDRKIIASLSDVATVTGLTQVEKNYPLIKFDLSFNSGYSYNWTIYHTLKEVKKNVKALYRHQNFYDINLCKYYEIIMNSSNNTLPQIITTINNFYNSIYLFPQYEHILNEFFGISAFSFNMNNKGVKYLEGWAYKRIHREGGRKFCRYTCICLECFLKEYEKYWVILNNDRILCSHTSTVIKGENIYFLGAETKIETLAPNIFKIKDDQISLTLKFKNIYEKEIWQNEILKQINNLKKFQNKYHAFTYAKNNNLARWFIDGKDYFEDLAYKLSEAKETIYITDWWMSPELFLIRPINQNIYLNMVKNKKISPPLSIYSRLMDILNIKANQGVKIYILIYKEMSIALSLNSAHVEQTFKKLNKKIVVKRHPSTVTDLLWSHHEKLVIIDQVIAYVGGLDLCWGRYDTHEHPIWEAPNNFGIYNYPMIDYANERIKDFEKVENYENETVKRTENVRMPWHDIHCRIIGPTVIDIAKHFIQRWNQVNIYENDNKGIIKIKENEKQQGWFDSILGSFDNESNEKKVTKIGADEYNNLRKKFMFGKQEIDEDHLLVRTEDLKKNNINNDINNNIDNEIVQYEILHLNNEDNAETEILHNKTYLKYYLERSIKSNVQALRSSSTWSAGLKKRENSILNAYYDLITNSQHYIYIENQFFISKPFTDEEWKACPYSVDNLVENQIAYYLRKRIERAYDNDENFKVYVFIPLLPGFAGDPEEAPTLQIVLKHTYNTICRNHGLSLIEKLAEKMGEKWKKYIYFYSLRNHALVNGTPKTELIYIHSKLMIIDDRKVLIGSANINDRSMKGNRDSEFAVIVQEDPIFESVMNGQRYMGANFAISLRKNLMAEHVGIPLNHVILNDPVSDNLYYYIMNRAKTNTLIYSDLFSCYPDDFFKNFLFLRIFKNKRPNLLEYELKKNQIIGHIVEFPLHFLEKEELGLSFFSKENLVPERNFV